MGWEKFCKCQKKLFGNLKSIANAKHIPRYAGIIRDAHQQAIDDRDIPRYAGIILCMTGGTSTRSNIPRYAGIIRDVPL